MVMTILPPFLVLFTSSSYFSSSSSHNQQFPTSNMVPSPRASSSPLSSSSVSSEAVVETSNNNNNNDRWLILDFDGTCTKSDTTALLPVLASKFAGDDAPTKQARLDEFKMFEQEYFREYGKRKESIFDDHDGGTTINGEFCRKSLDAALDSLDDVSTDITHKVSKSKCLAGLPNCPSRYHDLINADTELRQACALHPGCAEIGATAAFRGWKLAVLSINWCPQLIDAALIRPVREQFLIQQQLAYDGDSTSSSSPITDRLPEIQVWSNEIDVDGKVSIHVPGALAKRDRISALRSGAKSSSSSSSSPFIIYVGDSSTDLSGLLEADVGILLGDSTSCQELAQKWGIPMVPLVKRQQQLQQVQDHDDLLDPSTIWVAESWKDVGLVLQDLQRGR